MSAAIDRVPRDRLHSNLMHVQVFHEEPLADSVTDPSCMRELMDCSVMILMSEFMNVFPHFVAFCWLLVALNAHHLEQDA